MSEAASATGPAVESSSSVDRSGSQETQTSQLEAYLQDESFRAPNSEWSDGVHGVGVQERFVAAANGPDPARQPLYAYDYPYATSLSISQSSTAPSQYPATHIHNRASTAPSASQACAISSIDTELRNLMHGVPIPEEGLDDALVRPLQTLHPVYECTFRFLGCWCWFETEDDWRTHNLSHLHENTPPRTVSCPLCDFVYDDPTDGWKAWEARMSHIAAHLRSGQNISTSRPDFELYRYLWQKRIIDDAEYKELNGGGALSFQSTVDRALDDRRGRRHHHPRFPQTRRQGPRSSRGDCYLTDLPPSHTFAASAAFLAKEQTAALSNFKDVHIILPSQFLPFLSDELEPEDRIFSLVTLTGAEKKAFATTCEEFTRRAWPELGITLLTHLQVALRAVQPTKRKMLGKPTDVPLLKFKKHGLEVATALTPDTEGFEEYRLKFHVYGDHGKISKVIEQLAWLAAVCRKPEEGKLFLSCVELKERPGYSDRWLDIHLLPLKNTSGSSGVGLCWHGMFEGYVLASGFQCPEKGWNRSFQIPERGTQLGVEMPFNIMTLLSTVIYPINFGPGIVLKGERTALIPSIHPEDDGSVQWHFLQGGNEDPSILSADDHSSLRSDEYDGSPQSEDGNCSLESGEEDGFSPGSHEDASLSWNYIGRHCKNIMPITSLEELEGKRTFVGYFPKADVHLGTRDSGFEKIELSGAEYDDAKKIAVGNQIVGQIGTSVLSFFQAQVSGTLTIHRTAQHRLRAAHDSIADKIRNSRGSSVLMYDVGTKRGWLVPELSVILHLALAWASYQFRPEEFLRRIPFAEVCADGGRAAYEAIFAAAPQLCSGSSRIDDPTVQSLTPFFIRIGQVKEQQIQRKAIGMKETKNLIGYEFVEIANFEEYLQARRAPVDLDQSGGWLSFVSSKPDIPVFLCSQLDDPLRLSPEISTPPLWTSVPEDRCYLTVSMYCLRELSRRCGRGDSLKLYNNLYCVRNRSCPTQDQCVGKAWPCCSPLLKLSTHPSKKNLLSFDSVEADGALIIGKDLSSGTILSFRMAQSNTTNQMPFPTGDSVQNQVAA